MAKDEERKFRLRPQKPAARIERRILASAYEITMHSGRVSGVRKRRTSAGSKRARPYFRRLWEIGVFKDAEISKKAMATLQRVGRIRYEDLPLEHKDGRHIPVEFVSNVYLEGRRNVIQCNIRYITERKRLAMP